MSHLVVGLFSSNSHDLLLKCKFYTHLLILNVNVILVSGVRRADSDELDGRGRVQQKGSIENSEGLSVSVIHYNMYLLHFPNYGRP